MKRRAPEPLTLDASGVPFALLARRCVEVWATADGREPWLSAWARWGEARDRWLTYQGIEPHDHAATPEPLRSWPSPVHAPWSYAYLARTPVRLARQLEALGLPPDWAPSPADPDDFGEAFLWPM